MSDQITCIANLPCPILVDILSRLPPTTVLHCGSVCKYFLDLISQSEFSKLYQSRSPTSLIINQFCCFRTRTQAKAFKFLELEDQPDHHEIRHDPNLDLDLAPTFIHGPPFLIGSVHGLVCLNDFSNHFDTIHIFNPTTREYITLPKATGVRKYPNLVNYGFGFDPMNIEYKVVRIFQEEIHDPKDGSRYYKSESQVYTLGTGTWRVTGCVRFCFGCRSYGVNLHGKIHWLVCDVDGNESICCFELHSESFESYPTSPGYNKENCPNLRRLGVLGQNLCLCDNNDENNLDIWVMKEYGVTSSWEKNIVINIAPENNWLCYEMIHMLKVFQDGEILFLWRDDFLFSYHPEKKTVKILDVCEANFLATIHVSSSLSLSHFGREIVNMF